MPPFSPSFRPQKIIPPRLRAWGLLVVSGEKEGRYMLACTTRGPHASCSAIRVCVCTCRPRGSRAARVSRVAWRACHYRRHRIIRPSCSLGIATGERDKTLVQCQTTLDKCLGVVVVAYRINQPASEGPKGHAPTGRGRKGSMTRRGGIGGFPSPVTCRRHRHAVCSVPSRGERAGRQARQAGRQARPTPSPATPPEPKPKSAAVFGWETASR